MTAYPSPTPGLVIQPDGGVLRLTIDRVDRRNSLTDEMVKALTATIDAAGNNETVRVIHLAGAGEHFCSGFDLGERRSGPERPRTGSIQRRMHDHTNRLISTMLTTQTPIVCSARGWAIGLGLSLALASDFTVVADDAQLWAPFTTFGFTPDSATSWLIPRLMGVARARDMLMLGTKVSGADAATSGLVHRAVPTAELEAASEGLIATLAAGPTVAIGLTKLLMHRALTVDVDHQLTDEAWAMEVSSRSEDFKEYRVARREKRDPHFEGR